MVKEDKNRNCFGKNATVIATIEAPHTLLTGPPGLIKVKNDVMAMTVLQNCGPFGIWIERDTPNGFMTCLLQTNFRSWTENS